MLDLFGKQGLALWPELLSHLPGALASDLAEAFCQISIGAEKPEAFWPISFHSQSAEPAWVYEQFEI